jgi:D-serine deaminase-like pyridoxal phosphate-dependent protein
VGDQLRVRGAKSDDGSSIQAEEIVSGSFKNLAGLISSIDAAKGTVTLKDLATKKTVTVLITDNSNLKALPAQAAARFAARAKGGASEAGEESHAAGQTGGSPAERTGGSGRSAGADLSQLVSRLPNQTVADLKTGDAVMIVASQPDSTSSTITCVTLLSGVEPILAATPSGGPALTLSPWSLGGGDSGAQ